MRQQPIFPANRPIQQRPFTYDTGIVERPIFPASESAKYIDPTIGLVIGMKSFDYTTGEAVTWNGKHWINAMGMIV